MFFENHQEKMTASGPLARSGVPAGSGPSADDPWLAEALALAEQAGALGNVPVGAVLVVDGRIVGRGVNLRESCPDVSAHAEIMAMRAAGQRLGSWRLEEATLYVTLEPCLMCAGAILQARVGRVVYGATEPKTGAHQSVHRAFDGPGGQATCIEQNPAWAEPCADVMRRFFEATRARRRRS